MSRTYKTRPEWVKLNDPKFPTKERHQHIRVMREPTGRKIVESVEHWTYVDGWPKLVTEQMERTEYKIWSENIDCTIDLPEQPYQHWRFNKTKLCDKRPAYRVGCTCCSRSYSKRLSAKTQRVSINQQLHNAVRDYGWTTDPNEWYDVDITTFGVAEDWDYWD